VEPFLGELRRVSEDKYGAAELRRMGAIGTCPCGWTLVSPQGVEDVKKHAMMHMKEVHPETVMTPEELMTHIKQF
jgi:predicted small metal-binding protein